MFFVRDFAYLANAHYISNTPEKVFIKSRPLRRKTKSNNCGENQSDPQKPKQSPTSFNSRHDSRLVRHILLSVLDCITASIHRSLPPNHLARCISPLVRLERIDRQHDRSLYRRRLYRKPAAASSMGRNNNRVNYILFELAPHYPKSSRSKNGKKHRHHLKRLRHFTIPWHHSHSLAIHSSRPISSRSSVSLPLADLCP